MSTRLLYLISLFFLASCAVPTINNSDQSAGAFFDLKGFFKKEVAYLTAQQVNVQKTIRQNGQEESKKVAIEDWERELTFFTESDINKPSWRDQYSIDSVYNGNKLLLHYQCKDENLSTQVLDIEIVGDTVQSIVVVKNIKNQVYTTQQYLTYLPKKHYKINQTQDIVFLSEDDYSIEASYLYE
ncbi:MAG: hypothetical protein ACRBFS_21030 [Aureispira sp.]